MAVLYGRDNGLFEYLSNPLTFFEEDDDLYVEVKKPLRDRKRNTIATATATLWFLPANSYAMATGSKSN